MSDTIERLIGKIENKEIVLPEFQREFTWRRDQSRDLLDSFIKDYPTGSLLIWRTAQVPALKNMPDFNPNGRVEVLLDGQQRLTALYMFIKDDIPPYYSVKDVEKGKDPRNLYYNLITRGFRYYKQMEMQNNPVWVRVCDCFKQGKVDLGKITKAIVDDEKERFNVFGKLKESFDKLLAIKEVKYPIMYVKDDADLKHALTVFDRVNSGGTPLSESDIALAHMCSNWPETRRVFKERIQAAKREGFIFDLAFLIRGMNAVINCRAEYSQLHNLSESQLIQGWGKLDILIDYLINFLKDKAFIYTTNDINTLNVLIPILGYFAKNDLSFMNESKTRKLVYWMYAALFQTRFSGSVDQKLERDLTSLKSSQPLDSLITVLKEDQGEAKVTSENLDTRGVGHPLYDISCFVIRANGGVDWSNGLCLGNPIGQSYSIEKHHIFPKSLLAEVGYDTGNNLIHRKRVNEIANRVPLTKRANMDIFNKSPDEYLPIVEDANSGNLEKFMIPMDRDLWKMANYEQFLTERRKLIAKEINKHMKTLL